MRVTALLLAVSLGFNVYLSVRLSKLRQDYNQLGMSYGQFYLQHEQK